MSRSFALSTVWAYFLSSPPLLSQAAETDTVEPDDQCARRLQPTALLQCRMRITVRLQQKPLTELSRRFMIRGPECVRRQWRWLDVTTTTKFRRSPGAVLVCKFVIDAGKRRQSGCVSPAFVWFRSPRTKFGAGNGSWREPLSKWRRPTGSIRLDNVTRLHELTQIGVFDLHIICRLSTQDAADRESLEAQVTQAKHDAAIILEASEADIVFVHGLGSRPIGTNGKRVVKVSACHISGGTDWDDRQDLQEILNDARACRCRAVQTPNLDRVARNVEVAERFRRELLANGVRTLYEGRTAYDLADDTQQLLYGMRAQFSAWERRTITKRNFSGRLRAVREGFSLGGNVPFGTRLEPTGLRSKNRHFRVVVDETEMQIVRELFERRCAGETPRQLAAWTRSIGVQPNADHYLSKGPGLRANHIYVILRNDFYVTGRLAFTVSAPRWPSEVIEQQIQLPAPIPQSHFNEVAGLHERGRGTRLPKGTYLLSGLVYHRESGTPFQSRPTAGRWFYYRNEEWGRSRRMLYAARKLSRAALTPPGGNQPVFASIPKTLLERMVIGEVMKLLSHED